MVPADLVSAAAVGAETIVVLRLLRLGNAASAVIAVPNALTGVGEIVVNRCPVGVDRVDFIVTERLCTLMAIDEAVREPGLKSNCLSL